MDETYIPTLTHATERDVDLLLVEELYSNWDFVVWVSTLAGFGPAVASWDVKHSKRRTRSRREIDIFVELSMTDGRRAAVLIENKLDASEQPDQAESYREELDVLAAIYAQRAMIIICPGSYAMQHSGFTSKFNAVVSYEEVRDWFIAAGMEAGNEAFLRFRLRAELFDQAINKHRRGYTAIPDKVVGNFNANYVALLRKIAPEIVPGNSMLLPANPRESTSMIFDQEKTFAVLPKEIRPRRFAHELGRGSERRANYVAVVFPGWGRSFAKLHDELKRDTIRIGASFSADEATKIRPNPGLKMFFSTDPVDNQSSFNAQLAAITDGIREAQILRKWLCENKAVLLRWKTLFDSIEGRK